MKPLIRFEIWKGKKVITIRNEKGKLITRRAQKGSGLKSKADVYKLFKKNNTLAKDTVRISRKNPDTTSKRTKRITLKGRDNTKTVNVSASGFQKAIQIGKNTALLKTKKTIKGENNYQYVITIKWGDKQIETIGYSDLKGTPKQAFNRALSIAITKNLINYTHKNNIQITNDKQGFVKDGNNIVYFEYKTEIYTYIYTKR